MKVKFSSSSVGLSVALLLSFPAAYAATPASGTVSATAPTVRWTAGPFVTPNVTGQAGDPNCGTAQTSGVIWNPTLVVIIPPTVTAGTYTATVTHSVA